MSASPRPYDLAIVGSGPAGLAAAALAAELGLSTVVVDELARPGGQIYREVERVAEAAPDRLALLGESYRRGLALAERLRAAAVDYRPNTLVWQIDPPAGLWCLADGRVERIEARRLLLCTGAMERPVPLPGWTLPGVVTAGAVQVLLKTAGLVPEGDLVLLGNGPLLYQLLAQYQAAGVEPAAVLLTGRPAHWPAAARHLPGFLAAGAARRQGLKLLGALRRSRAKLFRGVREVTLEGDARVEAVAFSAGGRRHRLPARLVCLHEGVVPNVQLTRLLGCEHRWDPRQMAFRPRLDRWGNSSLEGVQVAGDGGGIAGAQAAEPLGRLAVLDAARALGVLSEAERDRRAAPERRALRGRLRARPFVDALYAPALAATPPADDTLVCRCEEVTAGQVREAVRDGCQGPNQVKSFLRCGMGPCQGRFCGLTVSRIVAAERGVDMDEVGYFRIRPPVKPIDLGALARAAAEPAA